MAAGILTHWNLILTVGFQASGSIINGRLPERLIIQIGASPCQPRKPGRGQERLHAYKSFNYVIISEATHEL